MDRGKKLFRPGWYRGATKREYWSFGRTVMDYGARLRSTVTMYLYSRIQRGDVDQCSFEFEILNEEIWGEMATSERVKNILSEAVFCCSSK